MSQEERIHQLEERCKRLDILVEGLISHTERLESVCRRLRQRLDAVAEISDVPDWAKPTSDRTRRRHSDNARSRRR